MGTQASEGMDRAGSNGVGGIVGKGIDTLGEEMASRKIKVITNDDNKHPWWSVLFLSVDENHIHLTLFGIIVSLQKYRNLMHMESCSGKLASTWSTEFCNKTVHKICERLIHIGG